MTQPKQPEPVRCPICHTPHNPDPTFGEFCGLTCLERAITAVPLSQDERKTCA
jgi:hypothetical protein